jgi:hypothetical protein
MDCIVTPNDAVPSFSNADDLTALSAALPHAPLAMPKQVLEREAGYWLRLIVRLPRIKTVAGL